MLVLVRILVGLNVFENHNGEIGMKIISGISLFWLLILFITVRVTNAQSLEEQGYNRGLEYAIQGNFQKAKEEFEKVLKTDPFYRPAELSLETIKDVIDLRINKEIAIHLFKGVSYDNEGQYDKAISNYGKVIEMNPKFYQAYNTRGGVYYKKGQYDQAISDFNVAIEINSDYAEAYFNRGIVYNEKSIYDKAISDFTKALEINENYAKAYSSRGITYFNKAKYDQAISDFKKAIEINPSDAKSYYNRGNVYSEKGLYDQAISDFNEAIDINPNYAEAYDNRGFAYFVNLENKAKGCEDFKKACELGECRNYNILYKRGDCP